MKKLLSVTVLMFAFQTLMFGQTFQWAKKIGNTGDDYPLGSSIDVNGNIISFGYFSGTVDFDPGPGIHNMTGGTTSMYILKLDSNGNFLWSFKIFWISFGYAQQLQGLTIDPNGNILITGRFYAVSGLDFDWGAGTTTLYSGAASDNGVVIKMDPNGNFIWAKSDYGGTGTEPSGITIDSNNDILTTGYFSGVVDFDPSAAVFNLTAGVSTSDIFILKLDSNGNFIWAKDMGGNIDCVSEMINLDYLDNIIIQGVAFDSIDADPGPGIYNLLVPGRFRFIEKLDNDGNFTWIKAIKITQNDYFRSMLVDPNGNIYSNGGFIDSIDFDPGPLVYNLYSSGAYDFFIQKLDPNGNLVWAKKGGGYADESSRGSMTDAAGNFYLIGTTADTVGVDMDLGPGIVNITSLGNTDIFIEKLDPNGNFQWVKQVGGSGYDIGATLSWRPSGEIYAFGRFSTTADLNPDAGVNNFNSSGGFDIFILQIGAGSGCSPTNSSISVTQCSNYTSPSGNYTWNSSGTYNDTIPNAAGCDSVITINLTINTLTVGFSLYPDPDTTQLHHWFAIDTVNGTPPYTYLWSWGDGNTSTGATPSHTYSAAAFYAICLSVTDGAGCTTTYCDSSTFISKTEAERLVITINVVTQLPNGIATVTPQQNNLNIIPNPCSTCEITGVENPNDLTVTDIIGRKLTASFSKSANGYNILLAETATGIFIIRNMRTGEVVKFVKQ